MTIDEKIKKFDSFINNIIANTVPLKPVDNLYSLLVNDDIIEIFSIRREVLINIVKIIESRNLGKIEMEVALNRFFSISIFTIINDKKLETKYMYEVIPNLTNNLSYYWSEVRDKEIYERYKEDFIRYTKNYYTRLLPMQYQKPKARATIELFIDILMRKSNYFLLKNMFNVIKTNDATIEDLGKAYGISRNSGVFIGYDEWVFGFPDENMKFAPYVRTFSDHITPEKFTWPDTKYYLDKTSILPIDDYKRLIKFIIELYSSKPNLSHIYKTLYKYFGKRIVVENTRDVFKIIIVKPGDLILDSLRLNNTLVWFIGGKLQILEDNDYSESIDKN